MRPWCIVALVALAGCVRLPPPESFLPYRSQGVASTAKGCAAVSCVRAGTSAPPAPAADDTVCAPATADDTVRITDAGGAPVAFHPRVAYATWTAYDFGCSPALHVVLGEDPLCLADAGGRVELTLAGPALVSGALYGSTDLAAPSAAGLTVIVPGEVAGAPLDGSSVTLSQAGPAGATLVGSIDALLATPAGGAAHLQATFAVAVPPPPRCAI